MASGSRLPKDQISGFLFLSATTIAVCSATAATTQLHHWVNRATQHELQLSRLQATTNRLDALEWRAINRRKIDPDLQALLNEQQQEAKSVLVELQTTSASVEDLEEVSSSYESYVKAVEQLLKLLKAGDIAEALEVDETEVDPSYESLRERIVVESAEAIYIAKTAGAYAFWGAMLTNLVLIAVISTVFHRYRQANLKVQRALVEYESIARSEQVLKQERELLESKVIDRTQELEGKNVALTQALSDLKQSQLQLIQSEKMSSLGQLVAGVAHEINNPVSFIHGNLPHVSSHTQDLLELVQAFQQHIPHPPAIIQSQIEAIDLDFLRKDLAKILRSMQVGTDRIREIVLSLRSFSRLDEAEVKAVNLHEGIDNTLLILHHRCQANAIRPAIQVVKEYGDLPIVECHAGKINQVFMNLFSNAIDAVEEASQGRTFEDLESDPNWIKIRTTVNDRQDTILITVIDNGAGIPIEVRSRLFDPFFTTKPIGKGTGLGLSISYQIITEQHNGKMYIDSTLSSGAKFCIEIPVRKAV
jgi:signal transduction histidine kinase